MEGRKEKEKEFVQRLQEHLADNIEYLCGRDSDSQGVDVATRWKLPYSSTRHVYFKSDPITPQNRKYETDLLISNWLGSENWRPLIIVECKYFRVNTHDLLAYSKKAEAHKMLHPYLRYGLVVGGYRGGIPGRMLTHGTEFDFMVVVPPENEGKYFGKLTNLLAQEVKAARTLWAASKHGNRDGDVQVFHRPLVTEWPAE